MPPKKGPNPFKAKAAERRETKNATVNYNYRSITDLQQIHQSNLKVGYMCIYQTFKLVSEDTEIEMGQAVNNTFMDSTGRRTDSAQGQKIAADDSRAVAILAEKYGFSDPKTAKGKYFLEETAGYAQGTEMIVSVKDFDSTLKNYFPDQGCVKGDDFYWDPDMDSKEFHCIYGKKVASGIDWTDVQDHFPEGPNKFHAVAWFKKDPG